MRAKRKIRYAVVGLGHIAQVAVLPAFKNASANSELVALVTDDPVKARTLAPKYLGDNREAVYDYDNYEKLLQSGRIDAVYICLPNHLHENYATRALQAGIHVLCEKPLALTVAEGERMKRAATKGGALLMTAYRLHFEPANLQTLKMCREGKLGELRYFSSDFSFQVDDPQNIRLKTETGGGPLWDIGIYCINAARNLFDSEPLQVMAFAETKTGDPRFDQVEEMVSATLRFPDERLASFTVSFGADSVSRFQICGTKGSVVLENAYEYAAGRELRYMKDEKVKSRKFKKSDQFSPEILYFSDCIIHNRQPEPSAEEGIADMRVILALYDSIERGEPIQLEPWPEKTQRLSPQMEKVMPPINPPKEIHVNPPHS
jgi:predicted dehydrogenase